MSFTSKADQLLEDARKAAETARSWTEFVDALSNQHSGLIARAFPDDMERQAFLDSQQYQELCRLRRETIRRLGGAAGAGTLKSGRVLVRLPRSLHTALDIEARREGVSLNQLAVSKLARPLRQATGVELSLVAQAFADVHAGFSADRIVVDPELNTRFIERCRELALNQPEYALNHALLRIRKNGDRRGIRLPPTTRETEFRDYDDYQFGAEIAARLLERTEGASLDQVLCDPDLRARFDRIALSLVAEPSVLKVRCAALHLRKTCGLRPGETGAPRFPLQPAGPVSALDLTLLPTAPATYVIMDQNRPLFAGETRDLRRRLAIHLEPGRMPPWIDLRDNGYTLQYSVDTTRDQRARMLWVRQYINAERPVLNYQDAA